MPDFRRSNCRRCEKSRHEVGAISWSGLCITCAELNMDANIEGMHLKTGEPWQRWRRAMAACVGAELPEPGEVES